MWQVQDNNCDPKRVIELNPGGADKGFKTEHDVGVPTGKNLATYSFETTKGVSLSCSITFKMVDRMSGNIKDSKIG